MKQMDRKIIIALGSNWEQEKNVRFGMERLRECFPGIRFSKMLWTSPIGIESDSFVNAIGVGRSDKSGEEIGSLLKSIERECGRRMEDKEKNLVKLDLDLLLLGEKRYREKDWEREYVKQLLEELQLL